jgi:ABC-type multidrug transport system fused ATPase/permease subunit
VLQNCYNRRLIGQAAVVHNQSVPYSSSDVANVSILFLFHLQATGQRVGIVLQSLATIGLGIGFALYYEWRLGLVTLCFTPLILVVQYFAMKSSRGETFTNQQALEKSTKVSKV